MRLSVRCGHQLACGSSVVTRQAFGSSVVAMKALGSSVVTSWPPVRRGSPVGRRFLFGRQLAAGSCWSDWSPMLLSAACGCQDCGGDGFVAGWCGVYVGEVAEVGQCAHLCHRGGDGAVVGVLGGVCQWGVAAGFFGDVDECCADFFVFCFQGCV